jgi:hypothetical protein
MATKKKTKKKRVGGVHKYVLIRIGRKVYRAHLSALGRPLADPKLIKAVIAFEKKHKKCCHGVHFGGVFSHPMYMMSFGNGHLPN